jgi:hypothetical protein
MKMMLGCLMLSALLSGCVPIGIRGSTVPLRGAAYDIPSAFVPAAPGAG